MSLAMYEEQAHRLVDYVIDEALHKIEAEGTSLVTLAASRFLQNTFRLGVGGGVHPHSP